MAKKKKPAAKKKKVEAWSGSEGRNLLRRDVKEGRIPNDMTFETAFATRKEFCIGETPEEALRLFEGRLKAAREHVFSKESRAEEEYRLFLEDRRLHPAPPFDSKGLPRWQGSEAQLFLLEDVKDSKHLSMSKEEFYHSRPAYHTNYPQQYITKKVEQAVKTEKFLHQMREKRAKKKAKRAKKNASS